MILNKRTFHKIIRESVKKVLKENKEVDITDKIFEYLRYTQFGQTNGMFSIEASKLHDNLMRSIGLYHDDEEDRRAFAIILNYIKVLNKRVGIKSINASCSTLHIIPKKGTENIVLKTWDAMYGDNLLNSPYKYGIVFKTNEGVQNLHIDYRYGSEKWSNGRYVDSAKMEDDMKQKIYNMGLVPALLNSGTYHENYIYSVGILPEFVNTIKNDEDSDVYFECEF